VDPARGLAELEALAARLGVTVRIEEIGDELVSGGTGLCRVRGRPVVFIDVAQSVAARTRALARALSSFDLDGVFVRPALRRLIELSRTSRP
jgi:hypothetical protein